jgi:hypothetical protein
MFKYFDNKTIVLDKYREMEKKNRVGCDQYRIYELEYMFEMSAFSFQT